MIPESGRSAGEGVGYPLWYSGLENSMDCMVLEVAESDTTERLSYLWASQVVLVVKTPPAHAGDVRDAGSIPGWGRPPGGGHGNPLQHSCLENPTDKGVLQPAVAGVAKSGTRLSNLARAQQAHVSV